MKFPLGRWRVLKMDDRNACIKMWMYLMPLNCTLKCGYKGKYSILWKIQFCKEVNSHKLVYRVNAISIKYVYSDTQVRSSQKTEVRWVDETECTLRSTEIRPCTLRKIKLFFNLDLRECVIYSRSFIYLYFFFFKYWMAYRILVLRPGLEPGLMAMKTPSPNNCTTREFPLFMIKKFCG